ncbi:UNVERIFIED_CONTAM: hypothetical protein RMT77_004943 [Armadillidium vulgare]
MTTSQLVKPMESTSSIFPTCVDTVEQSLLFVKRLVAVSVSSITYLRTIFPETSYKDLCVDGLYLKMLMDESSYEGANTLIKWIKSSFDAVDKGYLREMIFLVCGDKEKQSIIESYTFKFKYEDSGEVLLEEFKGDGFKIDKEAYKCQIQKPTIKMLRTIILLSQTLKNLPERIYLSMKLLYYEDKTPKNYEPEGFCPADDSVSVPENCVKLKVGNVQTPFHCVKLRAAYGASQFEESATEFATNVLKDEKDDLPEDNEKAELAEKSSVSSFEDIPINFGLQRNNKTRMRFPSKISSQLSQLLIDNEVTSSSPQSVFDSKSLSSSNGFNVTQTSAKISNEDYSVPRNPSLPDRDMIPFCETPNATPRLSDVQSRSDSICSTRSVSVDLAPTFSKEYPVRCPCNVAKDDGLMIMCDVCSFWQHGACFTIIEESQAPAKHYCEKCANPPSLCTDPRLCYTDQAQVAETCLYRRALLIMSEISGGRVSSAIVAQRLGVDISIGSKIVERLMSENVLKMSSNRRKMEVNMETLLNEAYPKHFSKIVSATSTQTQKSCTSIMMDEDNTEGREENIQNSVSLLGGLDSLVDSQMTIDIVNCSEEICLGQSKTSNLEKRTPDNVISINEKIGKENQNSSKRSKQGGKLSRKRKVSKTEKKVVCRN